MDLAPPSYTGIKPSMVKGGDLRVVEGTDATFQIAFDSPPAKASLVMTDPSVRPRKDKSRPRRRSFRSSSRLGQQHRPHRRAQVDQELDLSDRGESLRMAERCRKRGYKIEVLEDRPPRVAFEQPDEALEVHPVAEVLNRVRVGDDFGLTKAGIVFQFNDGDEQTLILKDFKGAGQLP